MNYITKKNTPKVNVKLLRCTSSFLLYYFVNVAMIKSGNSRQHKKGLLSILCLLDFQERLDKTVSTHKDEHCIS